jgi:hypothetical protein
VVTKKIDEIHNKNAALSALLLSACLAMPGFASAFDLNGAWASDADN